MNYVGLCVAIVHKCTHVTLVWPATWILRTVRAGSLQTPQLQTEVWFTVQIDLARRRHTTSASPRRPSSAALSLNSSKLLLHAQQTRFPMSLSSLLTCVAWHSRTGRVSHWLPRQWQVITRNTCHGHVQLSRVTEINTAWPLLAVSASAMVIVRLQGLNQEAKSTLK